MVMAMLPVTPNQAHGALSDIIATYVYLLIVGSLDSLHDLYGYEVGVATLALLMNALAPQEHPLAEPDDLMERVALGIATRHVGYLEHLGILRSQDEVRSVEPEFAGPVADALLQALVFFRSFDDEQ